MRRATTVLLLGTALCVLTLGLLAGPVSAQETAEIAQENETTAQENNESTPIESGTTVSGQIQNVDQRDVYTFDADAGDPVDLQFNRTGGTGQLLVVVYHPDGNEAISNIVGPNETVDLSGDVVESGAHRIVVTPQTANAEGSYSLTYVNENQPVADEPIEDAPDEEITPLEPNESVEGEINRTNTRSLYSVNATEGESIDLEIDRSEGNGSFLLVIIDPDREMLDMDVLRPDQLVEITTLVEQTGTHYIGITASDENASGSFSITSVGDESIDVPGGDVPDAPVGGVIENNTSDGVENDTAEIQTVQPGETVEGDIDGYYDYNDYRINASKGDSITVEVDRPNGSGVFAFGVTNDTFQALATDLIYPDEIRSVSTTVEENGTYYIGVVGVSNDSAGSYELTVNTGVADNAAVPASETDVNATDNGTEPADDATEIDSCTTISEAGTYTLTRDLADQATGTCIRIEANDVVLDGNRHLVQGNKTAADFEAFINASVRNGSFPWDEQWANHGIVAEGTADQPLTNVTVRNVETANWYFGVYYQQVDNGSVVDVTANNNGDGISVYNSTGLAVENNTVLANRRGGVTIRRVTDCTITETEAVDNVYGLRLGDLTDCRIADNELNANYDGMSAGSLENTTVDSNVADGNSWTGITLSRSDNVEFTNNTIVNTGGSPLRPLTTGILLLNASNNTFEDTTLRNNQYWAFSSMVGAANNTGTNVTLDDAVIEFTATNVAFGISETNDAFVTVDGVVTDRQQITTANMGDDAVLDLSIEWLPEAETPDVDEPEPANGTSLGSFLTPIEVNDSTADSNETATPSDGENESVAAG